MRALCLLRERTVYRRQAFITGLQRAGYELVPTITKPGPSDVLCIWNRYAGNHEQARKFESAGAKVVVAENGYLPDLPGGKWLALALNHHAGAGVWKYGGPERWDSLGVELRPWRHVNNGETIVLGQRGIGEPGIASPIGWAESVVRKVKGRIRSHPGTNKNVVPLEQDLARASAVVTWASSAALKALLYGVPVWYDMPRWIGGPACRPLAEWPAPMRDDQARLEMFRCLAWAQWTLTEIESGSAFSYLLR